MRVIGYSYDAEIHCVECATKYVAYKSPNKTITTPEGWLLTDGISDGEGNPIHPLFDIDEYSDSEYCGDCFIKII